MNPQLEQLQVELNRASERVRALSARVPEEHWNRRPEAERWSVAECIEHLILTSEASVPPLRKALSGLKERSDGFSCRHRRDPLGWLIWKSQSEGGRMRSRTAERFVPRSAASRAEMLKRWDRWQDELLGTLALADGLPLDGIKIPSAFNRRVKYNLFSALSILAVHQHRHLGQAELAARRVVGAEA